MKRQYFGTDGVRGQYGGPVMNDAFAWKLGAAAGLWLERQGFNGPAVIIGRDTRYSGPALERALAAGLQLVGARVQSAGIVPTPAVSFAVRTYGAALGIVVTASHNPARDNGIKFFNARGTKLDDGEEAEIESLLPSEFQAPAESFLADFVTQSIPVETLYLERLSSILPAGALRGWRIVVDAGNGASYRTTPAVLRGLGAEVITLADAPDGRNINAGCGSQHPQAMQAKVIETGAALGIAHDGDADRLILSDECGAEVDGDEILAILADHALKSGRLKQRTLVATVQSNLGLKRFMESAGGTMVQTAVGDRYVIEAMLAGGFNLGGESSGHIICTDVSPCGDGLAAALLLLQAILDSGRPLSQLRRLFTKFPQQTRALRVASKPDIETLPTLSDAIRDAERRLGNDGRVLVRYSGTEPRIRFLVEGTDEATVSALIERLERALRVDLPEPK
ncbi:MAG TPA: phosphoglucosamine mutase [Opitutaceae bacterium]